MTEIKKFVSCIGKCKVSHVIPCNDFNSKELGCRESGVSETQRTANITRLVYFFAVHITVSFNMVAALSHYFSNLNNFIICLLQYLCAFRPKQSAFCYVRPLPKDGNTSRFRIVFLNKIRTW